MEVRREPDRQSPADAVAGVLSAVAMAVSAVALAYRPLRLAPFAIIVALIAAAMSERHSRLAQVALAFGGACFVAGMAIAVLTRNPIF